MNVQVPTSVFSMSFYYEVSHQLAHKEAIILHAYVRFSSHECLAVLSSPEGVYALVFTQPPSNIVQSEMFSSCTKLAWVLKAYEVTPWDAISRYIIYLASTTIGLSVLGLGALATPTRLAPRVLLGAILSAKIMVLAPYFILDGRRTDMILGRYRINNLDELKSRMEKCSIKSSLTIREDLRYRFPLSNVWWQNHVMIVGTCVAGMLTSRILYLSVSNRHSNNSSGNRLLLHLPRPSHFSRPNRDIESALRELRASPESRSRWRDTQCAICLDDLDNGDVSLLNCNHVYHEKCLANWLRSSHARGKCPICKSAVWKEEVVSMDVEVRRAQDSFGTDSNTQNANSIANASDDITNRSSPNPNSSTQRSQRASQDIDSDVVIDINPLG